MGQVKTYASIQGYSLRYACTDVQKANFFFMLDTTVLVTLFDAHREIGTNILKEDENLSKELEKSER